jgi:hypothetical protein
MAGSGVLGARVRPGGAGAAAGRAAGAAPGRRSLEPRAVAADHPHVGGETLGVLSRQAARSPRAVRTALSRPSLLNGLLRKATAPACRARRRASPSLWAVRMTA